jgi:hypothetical protein
VRIAQELAAGATTYSRAFWKMKLRSGESGEEYSDSTCRNWVIIITGRGLSVRGHNSLKGHQVCGALARSYGRAASIEQQLACFKQPPEKCGARAFRVTFWRGGLEFDNLSILAIFW